MTAVYYNEWDPYCAAWLRNLIAAGHIPAGDVDERSIVDVRADDLRGYHAAHFFAGIGGWPYALRLAGVPDDAKVWTGSCPCQPLSCAGQRKGDADERHLWPAFHRLIAECCPAACFGEQVSGKDGLEWLSAVRADMEGIGYAIGAADLPACSVGAPHIRRRLFWVANVHDIGYSAIQRPSVKRTCEFGQNGRAWPGLECSSSNDRMANHSRPRLEERQEPSAREERAPVKRSGDADELGDSSGDWERQSRIDQAGEGRQSAAGGSSPWRALEWLHCIDGKFRPTQPGLQPLAHGVSARVGKLRAAGNAIVAPLAAEFIMAAMELTL